jgi:hypothetical protein
MPYGTVNADVIQTSTSGGILGAGNASIMKNRIINGAMVIDQRNAGSTVTPANQAYTLDRWSAFTNGAGVYTVGQSSTAPAGFKNSLLCTVTTVDSSVSGSDYYMFQHKIEGYNVADLGWGTSDAKTVTLSFWVRSSITGTYSVKLGNADSDRTYVATYTINSANTFEYKTLTITGDTTGTWVSTNGVGIEIRFGLALGSSWTTSTIGAWQTGNYFGATTASNNWIGTSGATFYITGVQLEVGSSATGFEYVNYQTSLANCQRYFQTIGDGTKNSEYGIGCSGVAISTTAVLGAIQCIVSMRSTPTASVGGTLTGRFYNGSSNFTSLADQYFDTAGGYINVTVSGVTNGSGVIFRSEGSNKGRILLSAEL